MGTCGMDWDELDEAEAAAEARKREGSSSKVPDNGGQQPTSDKVERKKFNPYSILGVAPDATDAVIKSAYRKGSLKVHPDHNPDPSAAAQFRELTEAKDFLLNPLKRLLYNVANGHRQRTVNIEWWLDWDQMFAEIDLSSEDLSLPSPENLGPERPILSPHNAFDILVIGATGLVGMLLCMLLHRNVGSQWTWAIAGRDGRKLKMLEEKFGNVPQFRGSTRVETPQQFEELASKARVVLDVTGPKFEVDGAYAEACIRAGTHYIENSGYPGDYIAARRLRDRLDQKAKDAKVCMIFFCGWTSVHMDVGVWEVVQHLKSRHKVATRRVDAYESMQGFTISGTSLKSYVGNKDTDAELKKYGQEFLLGGVRRRGVRQEDADKSGPFEDECAGMWVATGELPELWATRCTCGLLDKTPEAYGDDFFFQNWVLFGEDKQAADTSKMANMFLKRGYKKYVEMKRIPPPGCGPKERIRQECTVSRIFVAQADQKQKDPQKAYCSMRVGPGGMGDPYEGSAAIMIEAAYCVLDALHSGKEGTLRTGFGTPAYHLCRLGLRDRLVARGYSIQVRDGAPPQDLFRSVISSTMAIEG